MTSKDSRPRASAGASDRQVNEIKRAIPALRPDNSKEGLRSWWIRLTVPLLDDGRLTLRIDQRPGGRSGGILDEIAKGGELALRLPDLKAAVAEDSRETLRGLNRVLERLRGQVGADLQELGRDGASYVEDLDGWLRSRQFAEGPNLNRSLSEALKA
ncbi:MAG: helicase, partial [Enterovirga sp.]|nr:helicase [Enterovirga sp.]